VLTKYSKIWAQFRVDKIKEVNKDSLNDAFDQKLALDQAKYAKELEHVFYRVMQKWLTRLPFRKDMIKKLIANHRVRGEKNELLETQINDIGEHIECKNSLMKVADCLKSLGKAKVS